MAKWAGHPRPSGRADPKGPALRNRKPVGERFLSLCRRSHGLGTDARGWPADIGRGSGRTRAPEAASRRPVSRYLMSTTAAETVAPGMPRRLTTRYARGVQVAEEIPPDAGRGIGLPVLTAVAVLSAAALGYEILLTRLFSIVPVAPPSPFLVISVALLGFGASGTFLLVLGDRIRTGIEPFLALTALGFGLAAPGVSSSPSGCRSTCSMRLVPRLARLACCSSSSCWRFPSSSPPPASDAP